MSKAQTLEERIDRLTDALESLTSAIQADGELRQELVAEAVGATADAKPSKKKKSDPEAPQGRPPKETAAQKKKREAAERKAAEEAAEAEAENEDEDEEENEEEVTIQPRKSISAQALGKVLEPWMAAEDIGDDEDDDDVVEARKDRRQKLIAAFDHLGVKKLGEVKDKDDRRKVALYADNWIAGNEVNFEDLDELIDGDGDEDDNILG